MCYRKGVDQEKEGMGGRTGRSRGWGSHNQDILWEKELFSIKGEKKIWCVYVCESMYTHIYEYNLTLKKNEV